MTEMEETHVELNQFPVPRVGPRHSTLDNIRRFSTAKSAEKQEGRNSFYQF